MRHRAPVTIRFPVPLHYAFALIAAIVVSQTVDGIDRAIDVDLQRPSWAELGVIVPALVLLRGARVRDVLSDEFRWRRMPTLVLLQWMRCRLAHLGPGDDARKSLRALRKNALSRCNRRVSISGREWWVLATSSIVIAFVVLRTVPRVLLPNLWG